MEKGCVGCSEQNKCVDAFSEVSSYCGAYNHKQVDIFKEGIIDGSTRVKEVNKREQHT